MTASANAGWKTTEFWLSLLSTTVGAIMASGLPSDSTVMRVAGIATCVLNTLGYTVIRGSVKKAQVQPQATVQTTGSGRARRMSATITEE